MQQNKDKDALCLLRLHILFQKYTEKLLFIAKVNITT